MCIRDRDVAVVELSSCQLISMHQSPKIAVVTNVTPNHLDHHKDMQEYIDAKRNILRPDLRQHGQQGKMCIRDRHRVRRPAPRLHPARRRPVPAAARWKQTRCCS